VARQVVIAGGGFGGFYAARALERQLPLRRRTRRPLALIHRMVVPPSPDRRILI
jgi:NADH dehydrogenase FAD-containing subunit